jgi:hypothetical protein
MRKLQNGQLREMADGISQRRRLGLMELRERNVQVGSVGQHAGSEQYRSLTFGLGEVIEQSFEAGGIEIPL